MNRWSTCCLLAAMAAGPVFATAQKQPVIPETSRTARAQVPSETQWRIEDLYATPQEWHADLATLKNEIAGLAAAAKDWTSSPQKMKALFELTDRMWIRGSRLYSYASNRHNVDLANPEWTAMKGEIEAVMVEGQSRLAFRNPDLLALGEEKFRQYLKAEPALEPWRFSVESVFRLAPHVLPPEQQKILSLTGLFSGALGDAAGALTDVDLPPVPVTLADGSRVELDQAAYQRLRSSPVAADRSLVMKSFWENHKKYENTLATLLNGEMKRQLFAARALNFPDCLTARLFPEDIPASVYHALIEAVHANLAPLHRYLKLKKGLLGLDTFRYEDVYASTVPAVTRLTSYDDAWKQILSAQAPLGAEYRQVLERARQERWIDVYPNLGKESGAYSSGVFGAHPFIKLNFNGDYDAVSTMAHELGHAVHSHLANASQPFATSDYATFLAEIASTFNENLLMANLLKSDADDRYKMFVLGNYLERIRSTVYRQALFAEFELDMHRRVEEGGSLTPDWLNQHYLELTRLYYGHDQGVTRVDDYIQSEWSGIPHFYMGYYVFQYSTGLIASMALSEQVLHGGKADAERYLDVLRAGGNDYPLTILKKAGLDMTTAAPTAAALKRFDELVGELEKLAAKVAKNGGK